MQLAPITPLIKPPNLQPYSQELCGYASSSMTHATCCLLHRSLRAVPSCCCCCRCYLLTCVHPVHHDDSTRMRASNPYCTYTQQLSHLTLHFFMHMRIPFASNRKWNTTLPHSSTQGKQMRDMSKVSSPRNQDGVKGTSQPCTYIDTPHHHQASRLELLLCRSAALFARPWSEEAPSFSDTKCIRQQ